MYFNDIIWWWYCVNKCDKLQYNRSDLYRSLTTFLTTSMIKDSYVWYGAMISKKCNWNIFTLLQVRDWRRYALEENNKGFICIFHLFIINLILCYNCINWNNWYMCGIKWNIVSGNPLITTLSVSKYKTSKDSTEVKIY
jgi:hypothetical protein